MIRKIPLFGIFGTFIQLFHSSLITLDIYFVPVINSRFKQNYVQVSHPLQDSSPNNNSSGTKRMLKPYTMILLIKTSLTPPHPISIK